MPTEDTDSTVLVSIAPVLHITTADQVNFASQQNAVPFLRELSIINSAPKALTGLVLDMDVSPAFITAKRWTIDAIVGPGEVRIKDRKVDVDGQFLMGLTEALAGQVTFTLRSGDEVLAQETKTVRVLARNEWGGCGSTPELLAAFSQPNDPAIDKILAKAAVTLEAAAPGAKLDGYSSGSRKRVWATAAAIWSAIASYHLKYTIPPASFEATGQKIRTPSMIIDGGVATCLDTTMLFCSALEQAGLRPIVIMMKGHSFVGLWLQPEQFSVVITEDVAALRKRIALDEILVFETTLVTHSPAPLFQIAVSQGRKHLEPDELGFIHAVDLQRARDQKIGPLPAIAQALVAGPESGISTTPIIELPPELPDFDIKPDAPDLGSLSPKDRLDVWQRRLLDLTARNPLLNHRATASSLQLLCHDPGALEDLVEQGTQIRVKPLPLAGGQRDGDLYLQETGNELERQTVEAGFGKNELYSRLKKEELERVLVGLYRKAKSDLEEGGANTLFLSIGFLVWKRSDGDRKFLAPLLLVPVELKRRSARTDPVLSAHDDETRFNPTLLEMLRQDYDLYIPDLERDLPRDESGVNVVRILNSVREAVKNMSGFDVVDDVVLGTFSFAKYLMWKDLVDRTAQLRASSVVAHLLDSPRDHFSSGSFPEEKDLDRLKAPRDLFAPLDYDSSQLAAIVASAEKRDFVLIGPPGTGKSQSIANMISHNIALGRKILFVAEKRAALDVVYRRLDKLGLAPFCLELHSNKAKKRDVLNQLNRAWDTAKGKDHEAWEEEAERLKVVRDRLNAYADALHREHRNGLSVHRAIGMHIAQGPIPIINFSFESTDYHDRSDLVRLRDAAHKMDIQAASVENISDHPLNGVRNGDWSNSWQAEVVSSAKALLTSVALVRAALKSVLLIFKFSDTEVTKSRLAAVETLCVGLFAGAKHRISWCLHSNAPSLLDDLTVARETLAGYRQIEQELSVPYGAEAWRNLNLDALRSRWVAAETTWWPKSFVLRRAVLRSLQRLGGAVGQPSAVVDITVLQKLAQEGKKIDEISARLAGILSWQGFSTDVEAVDAAIAAARKIRAGVGSLATGADSTLSLTRTLSELLEAGEELLGGNASVGHDLKLFGDAFARLTSAVATFDSVTSSSVDGSIPVKADYLDCLRASASSAIEHEAKLNKWCAWLRARDEAMTLGLAALVSAIEQGSVAVGTFKRTFNAAYCAWWAARKIDEIESLRLFSASDHEDQIAKFKDLDRKVQELTAKYVRAKICAGIPTKDNTKERPPFALLNREIQKQSRNIAVRELFTQARDILPVLAPCVLMSPLSVAQYLPADLKAFDLVIFDEASQIAVWDAIGAIARGNQVVVAGDPNQMPPTNFFARSQGSITDDSDVEEDLDSILDEMMAAGIPRRTLTWHYRSQSEGLIAFSNSKYYDGRLITFPAPNTEDRSVKLQYVPNGIYLRGKDQTNHNEAAAIVAHVVKLLKDPAYNAAHRSLGIVSFNAKQQTLIENLLDNARRQNPDIEPHFSDESSEPVFVKNLESVQGDERDVILFSVTFGLDEAGAMTMNFGPLNQNGGWRRLNVAITRARTEMVVFSSIKAEHIDLSRTGAKGVEGLKEFLDYAERGVVALGSSAAAPRGDYDSPFEASVANALRQRGWTVHTQVGVGPFRIDLGIVHPNKPGRYLAAVECDGATYHRSATARDRDKVREGVLRRLGWEVLRVWSTDFWINPTITLDRIDAALLQLKAEAIEDIALSSQEAALPAVVADVEDEDDGEPREELSVFIAPAAAPLQRREALFARAPSAAVDPPTLDRYRAATPADLGVTLDPGKFHDHSYTGALKQIIKAILKIEAPIHQDVLVNRVARLHGFQRSGNLISKRVQGVARKVASITKESVGIFFWEDGSDTSMFGRVRLPVSDADRRTPEEIAIQELGAFMRMHFEEEDPIIGAARAMGILRLSAIGRARLETVLEKMRAL